MKKTTILGIGISALAIGLGGYFAYRHYSNVAPPERYRTQTITRGEVVQIASATGTLNPVRVVNVGTQVSGTVKKLYVDFNSKVEAGQILLELDTDQLQAKLRQSRAVLVGNQARLTLAKVKVERLRDLFKQTYVSRQELDQAESDYIAAQASVDQAKGQVDNDNYNLSNAIIRSPISGVVIDKVVDQGQTVAASFQTPTLIKIAQNLTQMQIDARFSEADLGSIKEGLQASFRVDAFPNRTVDGTVRQVRLNPTTEQNVVTYDVVIDTENPGQKLLPGMTAYVDIELGRSENVLTVPNAALRFKPSDAPKRGEWNKNKDKASNPAKPGAEKTWGQGKGQRTHGGAVYILVGEQLKRVPLKLGITDGRNTAIVEGELKEGDRVVLGEIKPATDSTAKSPLPSQGPGVRRF